MTKLTVEEYGLLRETLGVILGSSNSGIFKGELETGMLRRIALKLKDFVE